MLTLAEPHFSLSVFQAAPKNVNINLSAGSVRMSPILAEKRSHQQAQESTVGSSGIFKASTVCWQRQEDTEVMDSAASSAHTMKRWKSRR